MDRGIPLLAGSELECAAPRLSAHEPTPDAAAMALQRSHGLSNTPMRASTPGRFARWRSRKYLE
jgi:hypothetical protein